MLTENKFSKYLIYAIGEIVLVVIGILIALQVNNSNEVRKLRNINIEKLLSLSQELISNKKVLAININRVKDQVQIGLNMIDTLNTDVIDYDDRDLYLIEKVGSLGPLRLQPLTTTTLDELINSGTYSTIKPDSVKQYILAYNGKLEDVAATMKRFDDNFKNIELPYLTQHFSMIDMLTNRGEQINKADAELIGKNIPDFKRDSYYFSHNQEAFFNNRIYASINTNRYFDIRAVLNSMKLLNVSIDNLIETINSLELNE